MLSLQTSTRLGIVPEPGPVGADASPGGGRGSRAIPSPAQLHAQARAAGQCHRHAAGLGWKHQYDVLVLNFL